MEDSLDADDSTISSSERTTVLPELTVDNGNDENEDGAGDENKNASENEDQNENRNEAAGTETQAGEKAGIIEKNKAATYPLAISTTAEDALIPGEKSSGNSTLAEVMTPEQE